MDGVPPLLEARFESKKVSHTIGNPDPSLFPGGESQSGKESTYTSISRISTVNTVVLLQAIPQ